MLQVTFQRNLIALEDLLIGVGTVNQTRGFTPVTVTRINGSNLPYDGTFSMQEKFDDLQLQIDTLPAVVDQFGNLLTGLIDTSALDLNLAGRIWRKTINANLAEIYYGTELMYRYNPTTGDLVINYNDALKSTSISSKLIATGTQTFNTQTGKLYIPGMFVTASSDANPANYMAGSVTSYDNVTGDIILEVTDIGGSGTFADWTLVEEANAAGGSGDMLYSDNLAFLANIAQSRINLGVEIGADVQGWNIILDALAALVDPSGTIEKTGAGTVGVYTVTPQGKIFLSAVTTSDQRTSLGLGTAATLDVGTGANQIVQLGPDGKLPAVNGSNLTNISLSPVELQANIGFGDYFESAQSTFTNTFVGSFAHGLTGVPKVVLLELVNQVTDGGYSPGDIILIGPKRSPNDGGFSLWYNTTHIGVSVFYYSGSNDYVQKNSSAVFNINSSKWKIRVRAWA